MKGQKGFSLIELVIAIGLLGIIGVGILGALGTTSKALFIADERETARNLAASQMEDVKQTFYASSYNSTLIPPEYAGYSATITTDNIASNASDIQKITVTISHQGKVVTSLKDYKGR
jgi:prepilin-type N-terminal cleavage/methylation domain-containing protein